MISLRKSVYGMLGTPMSNYNKLIISLVFSALTVLQAYPSVSWRQAVLAGLGTFLVYWMPNNPKTPTVESPAVENPQKGFTP